MGYRDDVTALQGRQDILAREVAGLEQQLAAAKKEGEELRQEIRGKRVRLALARAWRWMAGHPKSMVALLVLVGIFTLVGVRACQKHREQQRRMAQVLGRDCATRLRVDAAYRGSAVLVNGLRVGAVPVDVSICRGYYRVQVVHRRALPWQRIVNVGVQPVIALTAAQVPFDPSRRPHNSIIVFSDPPGAILFANGEEVGRTPVLLPVARFPGKELLLALWSRSVTPIRLWRGEKRPRALWFHLGRPAVERRR